MSDKFEFIGTADKPALVAFSTPEWLEAARVALDELGYKVHTAATHGDFLVRFTQVQYQVVVIEERFAANDITENLTLQAVQKMPMNLRRHCTFVLFGESFAQFVQSELIEPAQPFGVPAGTPAFLDDVLGNVGIVVGAAGRNKAYVLDPDNNPTLYKSVPARTGVNGTLENVFARNLISAVAGSVDRIASIQVYKAVTITGETGGDKNARLVTVPGGLPTLVEDFADANGIPTTSHEPVLEGIEVDGAIISKKFLDSKGRKIAPPLNGYLR